VDAPLHLRYCRPDTPFFDAPAADPTATGYLDECPAPADGWQVTGNRDWTSLTPPDAELPAQGWKVHVSTVPDDASEALARTWDYCVGRGVPFKFLRSRDVLVQRSSKYGDRSASGKFITLYPRDEDELASVLDELGERLDGLRGPYILSDLRWGAGPLYVRYGGFKSITRRNDSGAVEYLITDPHGRLVEDRRGPSFRPPEWVTIPECLHPAIVERSAGRLTDFPYKVTRALHFSNGGGVYRATDTRTGREVLLREARPLAGLDGRGDDSLTRLERERWALSELAGVRGVPELLDYRRGNEHYFLVRDYVEGAPLSRECLRRNPLLRGDSSPEAVEEFTRWALHVLAQVTEAVREMHDRGVVFGDLHPGNVLVDESGTVTLIDFETATTTAQDAPQAIGAVGFTAPSGYIGAAVDRYALGVLRLAVFLPFGATLTWGLDKLDTVLELVRSTFPVGDGFENEVRVDLGPAPHEGPTILRPDPDAPARTGAPGPAEWVQGLVDGVLRYADLTRDDRLYPGDAEQFFRPEGGVDLATGAAGVVWSLTRAGVQVPATHLDWLEAAADRVLGSPHPVAPGCYDGLSGIALSLAAAGRPDRVADLMARVDTTPVDDVGTGLHGGLAGIGLVHLALDRPDAAEALAAATAIGTVLAERTDTPRAPGQERPGLLRGATGAALFWLRLFERTADEDHLDRAEAALRADLRAFGWAQAGDDTEDVFARLPFLAHGVAGAGMVLHDLLRHRRPADLVAARDRVLEVVSSAFAVQAGLFNGAAGLLLALTHLDDPTDGDARVARLRAALERQVVDASGVPVMLGREALRLSTDLSTGSAGVVLACRGATLPFFGGTP